VELSVRTAADCGGGEEVRQCRARPANWVGSVSFGAAVEDGEAIGRVGMAWRWPEEAVHGGVGL